MKLIEVVTSTQNLKPVISIAEQHDSEVNWIGSSEEQGKNLIRILVNNDKRQLVLDALQGFLGSDESSKILVLSLEAVLPRQENEASEVKNEEAVTTTREELYNDIVKNARLDSTYLLLVFLSTVVVAIGLLEDNVAVVIGAMVIAPLLGPNIALALGAALGDISLMWKAVKTTMAGITLALSLSMILGFFYPLNLDSHELLARTDVGLDSVTLALASGAAAVISLTTGLASVLVGVMVAVALLPPTATLGLMIGAGQTQLAVGAALLLAVNIVSVNLAAKIVFWLRGVKPRSWLEKQKANQSMVIYLIIWILSLTLLIGVIFIRQGILKIA
ncbi:MAG: TIGR00341 family protein [Nitrospinaceae bacterium]|nr:TIGR00341 family protein [Nitrospina sp.]MBT5375408.1 TIGR00341 family protein [Nitrospinaceae bacterium]MBT5868677.1 TIGR00341 family protein [Nitrospinaceae bacterium]MBT6346906.1 TIGR00341 family protein [Nitrospina sp.]